MKTYSYVSGLLFFLGFAVMVYLYATFSDKPMMAQLPTYARVLVYVDVGLWLHTGLSAFILHKYERRETC